MLKYLSVQSMHLPPEIDTNQRPTATTTTTTDQSPFAVRQNILYVLRLMKQNADRQHSRHKAILFDSPFVFHFIFKRNATARIAALTPMNCKNKQMNEMVRASLYCMVARTHLHGRKHTRCLSLRSQQRRDNGDRTVEHEKVLA